jgi:hypothetical protein
MIRRISIFNIALVLLLSAGCRTLDPGADTVLVSEKAGDKCKNLGVVNVDWSFWGASSESINAMRNQVKDKGGNLLVQTGNESGIAYSCPQTSIQ